MIMISMPMGNDPDWRTRYVKVRHRLTERGYKVTPLHVKVLFDIVPEVQYPVKSIPLLMMGNSMYRMAVSDTVYFCKGWEDARGCVIEHEAAEKYGLNILYEENEDEN